MNESKFSAYLVSKLRAMGALVQRLEITTGAGVPDLCVIYNGCTYWLELKYGTNHIRPAQAVWGMKALEQNVNILYVCGYEDRIDVYSIKEVQTMTKTFKLTNKVETFPRTTQQGLIVEAILALAIQLYLVGEHKPLSP